MRTIHQTKPFYKYCLKDHKKDETVLYTVSWLLFILRKDAVAFLNKNPQICAGSKATIGLSIESVMGRYDALSGWRVIFI